MLLILPIYTCRPCVVYGGRLRSHIVMTVLSFKKNPISRYAVIRSVLLLVDTTLTKVDNQTASCKEARSLRVLETLLPNLTLLFSNQEVWYVFMHNV